MFKLTDDEITFIKKHIKSADEILKSDDLNDILRALDRFMLYDGRINRDYNNGFNADGLKSIQIFDAIYARNTDEEGYQIEWD